MSGDGQSPEPLEPLDWVSDRRKEPKVGLDILRDAYVRRRPVVLLTGAGISVDAGVPLASQLSEYLVQVATFVERREFLNVRRYIEQMRWPSRHDLRVALMWDLDRSQLDGASEDAELRMTQRALLSELRRTTPTFADVLGSVFEPKRKDGTRPGSPPAQQDEARGDPIEALRGFLANKVRSNVSYRSLLFHLCEGQQPLIDACFDHFFHNRAPTTTHQFIVFLAQLLNTRVILSTNFDPLLEHAFAEEDNVPTVFEIQGEGSIPSSHLLLSQSVSIVKLHGGRHQMRTGFDLDDPMSSAALASFRRLFQTLQSPSGEQPLLLVMGYSGSDRRVMDAVDTLMLEWTGHSAAGPCVLWVGRPAAPPTLLVEAVSTHPAVIHRQLDRATPSRERGSSARADRLTGGPTNQYPAHYLQYPDARLFLVDAYQYLANRFPVTRSFYQAVHFVPHTTVDVEDEATLSPKERAERLNARRQKTLDEFNDPKNVRVHWVKEETAPDNPSRVVKGSSSWLADLAQVAEDQWYTVIWIDIGETPGVAALLDVISERLTKLDSRLQAVRRPQLLSNLLYPLYPPSPDREMDNPGHKRVRSHELKIARLWLQHALRRGRYYLALDSFDEFPASHPATRRAASGDGDQAGAGGVVPAQEAWKKAERALFEELIGTIELDKLGDSRIAIATRGRDPESEEEAIGPTRTADGVDCARAPSWSEQATEVLVALNAARSAETDLEKRALALSVILSVASSARRPRDGCMLVWCATSVIEALENTAARTPLWRYGMTGTGVGNPANEEKRHTIRTRVSELWDECAVQDVTRPQSLGGPAATGLLRLDGGHYWMHHPRRQALYEATLQAPDECAAWSHHVIALYHHDELYDRSRDPRAFIEYLFHRTAALRLLLTVRSSDEYDGERASFVRQWLRRVVLSLQREKATLMSRARLPSLIHELFALQNVADLRLSTCTQDREVVAALSAELWGIIGDFLLAGGHPHSAVRCHLARLDKLLPGVAPHGAKAWDLWTADDRRNPLINDALMMCQRRIDVKGEPAPELRALVDRQNGRLRLAKALSDLVCAIQYPLLTNDWRSLPGPKRSGQAGQEPQQEEDDNEDWIVAHGFATRDKTIDLCKDIYQGLEGWIQEHTKVDWEASLGTQTWHTAGPQEQGEAEIASGLLKRRMEFKLINRRCFLADGAVLYAEVSEAFTNAIERETSWPDMRGTLEHLFEADRADDGKDADHDLLRLTKRRLRHECYRFCLQALRFSQEENVEWERIRLMFDRAEVVLNRHGEPADLQALAITRLLHASQVIERVERLFVRAFRDGPEDLTGLIQGLVRDKKPLAAIFEKAVTRPSGPDKPTDGARAWNGVQADIASAQGLIARAESLLNEGRGENRWRLFLLLTQARLRFLTALTIGEQSQQRALQELQWAGRYLSRAFTNCGRRTDRRRVLTSWWQALKHMSRAILGPGGDFPAHWAREQGIYGVWWDLNWRTAQPASDDAPPKLEVRR